MDSTLQPNYPYDQYHPHQPLTPDTAVTMDDFDLQFYGDRNLHSLPRTVPSRPSPPLPQHSSLQRPHSSHQTPISPAMSLPSMASGNATRANTLAPSPQPPTGEFGSSFHNSSPLDPDGFVAENNTPLFDDVDDISMYIDDIDYITEQPTDTGAGSSRLHTLDQMTVPSVSIIPDTPGIFSGTLGFGPSDGSFGHQEGSLPSAPGFSTIFNGADSSINEQHAWLSVEQAAPSRAHSAPGSVIFDGQDKALESTGMERSNSLQDAGDRHKPRRKLDRKATIDMGNDVELKMTINEAVASNEREAKNEQVANWIRRLSNPETPKTDGFLHVSEKGTRSRRARSLSGFTADFSFSLHGRRDRQASTVSAHLAPDELHSEFAPTSAGPTSNGPVSNNITGDDEVEEEEEIPRPVAADNNREQIFRYPKPWKDGMHINTGESLHPATAQDAMTKFELMNKNIETASRVATFGSRRLSLNDMEQFLQDPEELRRLKLRSDTSRSEEKEDLKKRMKDSLSNLKRGGSIRSQHSVNSVSSTNSGPNSPTLTREKSHRFSGGLSHVKDKLRSLRTPKLDTASALTTMANASTAVGSATVHRSLSRRGRGESEQSEGSQSRFRKHRLSATPGANGESMMSLLKGKPSSPGNTLSSPLEDTTPSTYSAPSSAYPQDNEPQSARDSRKNSDDSSSRNAPTYEEFVREVYDIYPKLEHWLVDRIANEQCKRYKTLLDYRKKHEAAVREGGGRCPNGDKCQGENPSFSEHGKSISTMDSGSDATRPLSQDDDEDDSGVFSLPAGIPVPPVTSFTNPVTFECPICFKLKKFGKPSDWSKHVHEDLQPFTCTYKACTNPRADAKAEPKSFKRKADWVRHENEKHRKLEWWTCVLQDCNHICYRRDNFLQHLVREHRMSDPKQKAQRKHGFAQEAPESDRTNQLVNDCRKETSRQPTEEACIFCGQISNEWKKLHQHLGTHMEQLALPVLERVMGGLPLRKLSEAEERQKQDSIDSGRYKPAALRSPPLAGGVKLETAMPGIARTNTSNSSMSPLTGSPYPHTTMDGYSGITSAPTSMPSNMQALTNHMMAAHVSSSVSSHPLPLAYNQQPTPIYTHQHQQSLPMSSGYPSQQMNITSMPTDYGHIPASQGGNQFVQHQQHQSPVGYIPLGNLPNNMQASNADMQFPIYPTAFAVHGGFIPDMGVGTSVVNHQHQHNGYTMEQESMEQWPGSGY